MIHLTRTPYGQSFKGCVISLNSRMFVPNFPMVSVSFSKNLPDTPFPCTSPKKPISTINKHFTNTSAHSFSLKQNLLLTIVIFTNPHVQGPTKRGWFHLPMTPWPEVEASMAFNKSMTDSPWWRFAKSEPPQQNQGLMGIAIRLPWFSYILALPERKMPIKQTTGAWLTPQQNVTQLPKTYWRIWSCLLIATSFTKSNKNKSPAENPSCYKITILIHNQASSHARLPWI